LLVAVLKGAMLFMSDLCRAIELPVDVDFMAVSSYGSATRTSGVVRIVKDLDAELDGRHVLVVEDIIDSGLTLSWLVGNLESRGPASVRVCVLLRKPMATRIKVDVAYTGFDIEDEFVVGYGLDYAERYRNLPFIGTLAPAVYGGDTTGEGGNVRSISSAGTRGAMKYVHVGKRRSGTRRRAMPTCQAASCVPAALWPVYRQ
jgi:hypoxanthine phosphoribosyltransferase